MEGRTAPANDTVEVRIMSRQHLVAQVKHMNFNLCSMENSRWYEARSSIFC